MKNWIKYILVSTVIIACTSTEVSIQNLAFLYNPELQTYNPEVKTSFINDSVAKISVLINPNKVYFRKERKSDDYKARIQLNYKVFQSYGKSRIHDQDTVFFEVTGIPENTPLIEQDFLINTLKSSPQYLFIKLTDLNTKKSERYVYHLNNTLRLNSNNTVISRNLQLSNKHGISSLKSVDSISKLFVRSFHRYRPLSPLPYEMYLNIGFNYAADSNYSIYAKNNQFDLDTRKRGFYYLTEEQEGETGVLITSFGENFPYIRSINDITFPLQLLCTNQEFNRLIHHQNRKLAVDNFWIDNCGSRERAKPVIKKFYHRVEEANLLFTNIKEGWKTDRGMIYIIYGAPTTIHKTENSETWIYGEEDNLVSLNFVFRKIINPFTNNLFELNRSSIYKNSWYRMVDAWREGRIYTDNEE